MIINKRTDIISKKKFEKSELVRIAIKKNGDTYIDFDNNNLDRGIYFHKKNLNIKSINIIENNIKKRKGDFKLISDNLNDILKESN